MELSNIITPILLFLVISSSSLISFSDGLERIPDIPIREDRRIEGFAARNVGCLFHDRYYELNSKWNPVLEPYGMMYCLECSCAPIVKKGFLQQQGQVNCRKISQECPDVSDCEQTPILPQNSCCKICPGDGDDNLDSRNMLSGLQSHDFYGDDLSAQSSNSRIEHQASYNGINVQSDFASLMTMTQGRHNLAALVRMKYQSSALRITATFSASVNGTFEFKLIGKSPEPLYSETFNIGSDSKKMCLVSRDAFRFVDQLKSGAVIAELASSEEDSLFKMSGSVMESALSVQETFTSLAVAPSTGAAATMSLGLNLADMSLVMKGRVSLGASQEGRPKGKNEIRVTIEVLRDRRVVYQNVELMYITGQLLEVNTVWPSLSTSHLKQLARGRLSTKISIPSESLYLEGSVETYHHCGRIRALLTGLDSIPPNEETGTGIVEISLRPEGTITFQMELRGVDSKIQEIYVETDGDGNAPGEKITRLAREVDGAQQSAMLTGAYDKPDAREIQLLLEGKLFISIVKQNSRRGLRGQIAIVPFISQSDQFAIMDDRKLPISALSWCISGNACSLVCVVMIPRSIVGYEADTRLYIDYWSESKVLANFVDRNIMEIMVSENDVQNIGATRPTLRLDTAHGELFAQASIPESCFEDEMNDNVLVGDQANDPNIWIDPNLARSNKCSHDGTIYSDGDTWKPTGSGRLCSTCSCKRDRVLCFPVVCPAVECSNPVTLRGECCPSCPEPNVDTTKTCYFPGDGRDHRYGTIWHPFMYPGGYFKCAICFCKTDGTGFDCKQTTCPPPTGCPEHEWVTKDGDCCATCPERTTPAPRVTVESRSNEDMMLADNDMYNMCRVGEKLYSSGEIFSPEIGPFGTYDNVQCTCREGQVTCRTIECDCTKRSTRRNRCCMKQCRFSESDVENYITTKDALQFYDSSKTRC